MHLIYVIHGDEPQMIEDKKNDILALYSDKRQVLYTDETPIDTVMGALFEQSLFEESKVIILHNTPLLKTTSKSKQASTSEEWLSVYKGLLEYKGDTPLIVVNNAPLDKRVKHNKEFLKIAKEFHYNKLTKEDLIKWVEDYCYKGGHPFSKGGRIYFYGLMDLWNDVPLHFLRTEFDRLFLFLNDKDPITAQLLQKECSDFANMNVFKFTDAFYEKNLAVMLEMVPFVTKANEIDRFFAYLESQLRMQLIVFEGYYNGDSPKAIFESCKEAGLTNAEYPINLAYRRCQQISYQKIASFLQGLYELVLKRRKGEVDPKGFANLCILYCK